MKKLLVVLAVLVSVLMVGTAFAYNLSYSPEFIRTQSRNASTDVDAAIYNPAGLVMLQNGLYINVANNMAYIKYSHTDPVQGNKEVSADTISWLTPDFNIVYKQDKWAAFVNMFVIDGGAALEYKGSPLGFASSQLVDEYGLVGIGTGAGQGLIDKASSGYGLLAFSYGASYALTDMVAFSAGLRNFYYFGETKYHGYVNPGLGALELNYKENLSAWGTGGFIGLNITPMKDMNIGISYQTAAVLYGTAETKTTLGTTTKSEDGYADEASLPAYLALGVGYNVMPELNVQLSYTLTFEGERKWGKDTEYTINADRKNTHAIGLGAEYKVNDMIKASGGVLYSTTGDTDDTQNPYSPGLDKVAIGVGAAITAMPGLTIDLGLVDNIFLSQKVKDLGDTELKKTIWGWGIGVTYKAM